ncbi:MAG: transcriptional regulator [Kofleriaceae bacterium]
MDAHELALAEAVTAGSPDAIREFETKYLAPVRPTLRSMSLGDSDIADVEQAVRVKLLVGDRDSGPRLARYAGQGRLGGLVRVAAVREALMLLRSRRVTGSDDWLDALACSDDDPALVALKTRHRVAFKASFEQAVRSLTPREHAVLRLHLVRHQSIDQIGAVYGVHRATAARWIDSAKRALRAHTNKVLAERYDLRGPELERVVALIESRIELSIDRLLASAAQPLA